MKKYLPVVLLVVGVLAVVGVFLSLQGGGSVTPTSTPAVEESAPEIVFDQRPFVSLTPRSDGHWLRLSISGINKVTGSTSVDYLLEYTAKGDINQGVPGNVKLTGITTIDRDLLLGSESSGKFRYDEGVSQGKLTLKFRDVTGKLLGKLSTDFHLQNYADDTFTSIDGVFSYKLDKSVKKGYFVTLSTFGVIEGVKGELASTPYGVFSSEIIKMSGKVALSGNTLNRFGESKWSVIKGNASPDLGVFVATN